MEAALDAHAEFADKSGEELLQAGATFSNDNPNLPSYLVDHIRVVYEDAGGVWTEMEAVRDMLEHIPETDQPFLKWFFQEHSYEAYVILFVFAWEAAALDHTDMVPADDHTVQVPRLFDETGDDELLTKIQALSKDQYSFAQMQFEGVSVSSEQDMVPLFGINGENNIIFRYGDGTPMTTLEDFGDSPETYANGYSGEVSTLLPTGCSRDVSRWNWIATRMLGRQNLSREARDVAWVRLLQWERHGAEFV